MLGVLKGCVTGGRSPSVISAGRIFKISLFEKTSFGFDVCVEKPAVMRATGGRRVNNGGE